MENKLSLEEQFSLKVTNCLKQKIKLTEVEEALISYGLSVFLITLVKTSVVYITSFLLGTVFETLICHLSFCIVRHYSRGFHAKSSFNCGLGGTICFSLFPWLICSLNITLNFQTLLVNSLVGIIILFYRSPASTSKNQVKDQQQRVHCKIRSIFTYIILTILLTIFFKETNQIVGLYGLTVAVILTLPLEKLFWRN